MAATDAPVPAWPRRLLTFVVTVVRRFIDDRCLLHASALTYTSLLSLVPLLALMFAILKGLGVQRRLEPLLLSRLSLSPEVTANILTYIDNTNFSTLGAVGAAALITTVISVLGSIEASFNHIWRVRQGRPYWRKVTDYVSTVLITPLLLLAAVTVTSSLQQEALLQTMLQTEFIGPLARRVLELTPMAFNIVALGALYAIMPNRRPRAVPVLLAAIIAGYAWQFVQSTYVSLQVGVARSNAIYGALAQLPVTLVWFYVSWVIVLAGAEIAAVWEFGSNASASTPLSRWGIALHALLRAAEAFRAGQPITPTAIAHELGIDGGTSADVLAQLAETGLLATLDGASDHYLLGRDPASIDLASLNPLLDGAQLPPGCDARVLQTFASVSAARDEQLRQTRLSDLLPAAQ
jgi:membrane protein